MKTVVGLFNTTAEAQRVKQALVTQGYSSGDISVHANDMDDAYAGSDTTSTRGTASTSAGSTATGIGQRIGEFFSSLTGGDNDAHEHYAQGVNQGGALLSVKTDDDQANSIAALLRQHGARDIEGATGTSGYADTSSNYRGTDAMTTGQTAIPVVEEELVVGKREVDRGGVRVYSHVTERPVSADVTLRDERIDIERRPVNRAATAADFQTGSQPIELRAMGEEAVVGKSARVVEEVYLGKQTSDRTETVQDTVRKTEVDVEQLAGSTTSDRTGSKFTTDTATGSKDRY